MVECGFSVPVPAVPKERPRVYGRVAVTPPRTAAYERAVALQALAARPWNQPTAEPVSVVMWFYYRDRRHRDLDNLVKSVLDGITGILIEDDHQVVHLEAVKILGSREAPHVDVSLRILR